MAKKVGRSKKTAASARTELSDVCDALEALAPIHLAQDWDNVGLLAGDRKAPVRSAMLCIDLTSAVVDEAIEKRVQLLVCYHPPIFKPISRLTVPSEGAEQGVFRCIAAGIALYATHTALDAAEGGTNDVIARLCGVTETEPLEYQWPAEDAQCKIVVFVPGQHLEKVAEAMFGAGAGWIGDYERCSFRLLGTGTFRGTDSTCPVIGEAGRFERVKEVRLEAIAPRSAVPAIISAIRRAHPYEEPAFDVYPLVGEPQRGIGRCGRLPRQTPLAALARKLKSLTGAACVQIVGEMEHAISRIVVCVGAAGSLPFAANPGPGDVIITGELRHHDALTIKRHGCAAIALGHWASERPVLQPFAERLSGRVKRLRALISDADRDPFAPV